MAGDKKMMALVFIAVGVQLFAYCMGTRGFIYTIPGLDNEAKDKAAKAFLIMSLLVYLTALVLLLIVKFAGFSQKLIVILAAVLGFVGVVFTLIGLSIYGAGVTADDINSYSFTMYVTSSTCVLIGSIVLVLDIM